MTTLYKQKKKAIYAEIAKEYDSLITHEEMMEVADEMEIFVTEVREYDKLLQEKRDQMDELQDEIDEIKSTYKDFEISKKSLVWKYEKEIINEFGDVLPNTYPKEVKFHLENNCMNLAKLGQFYGIIASDREEEELQKAEEFIEEIRFKN